MSAQHTPGPWLLTPESETVHGWSDEGEALIVVYELGTNEADHRLISAAPELLDALQPFVAHNSDAETITIIVRAADVKRARAVIAKATGVQQ